MDRSNIVIVSLCVFSLATTLDAKELVFDGVTDSGWSLINGVTGEAANDLNPVESFGGKPGLQFDDRTGGVNYYSAPGELLSTDLTGETLDFFYQLNSAHEGGPFEIPLDGFAEVYINGNPIGDLDIIDESQMDSIQPVTIDFSDPAFAGIDLANVTSLYIKAEWWGDDVKPSVESYILGTAIPEPASDWMVFAGALGLLARVRRKLS